MTTNNNLPNYLVKIRKKIPNMISKITVDKANTPILHTTTDKLLPLILFITKHVKIYTSVLVDITAVDFPERKKRFQLSYNLLSILYSTHFRINLYINEWEKVPSISSQFKCAVWQEREVWDMFGIFFIKNPDLRRILTDYGFEGHPLRKDFPLSGFTELRYDETQKRIVADKVELQQEFRTYNFINPWINTK